MARSAEGLQGPGPLSLVLVVGFASFAPISIVRGTVVMPDESMNDFIDCGKAFVSQ